jgi:uncharacterized membrane protein YoaK (UPF0700 family)
MCGCLCAAVCVRLFVCGCLCAAVCVRQGEDHIVPVLALGALSIAIVDAAMDLGKWLLIYYDLSLYVNGL